MTAQRVRGAALFFAVGIAANVLVFRVERVPPGRLRYPWDRRLSWKWHRSGIVAIVILCLGAALSFWVRSIWIEC